MQPASGKIFTRNSLVTLASLAFASLVCAALIIARVIRTGSLAHIFLVWNLALAWIPFVYAFIAYRLYKSRFHNLLLIAACAMIWLLFLPNAPYLLTDLIHLRVENNPIFWYDLLMLLWFSWTGFLLGFASLYLMQQVVADALGRAAGWVFVFASLSLSSFGIYIGRFLRWNSWDVFNNPVPLFLDIYDRFRHPLAHFHTHAFSLILAVFLICVYITLTALTHLRHDPHPR
jgi:uncharacterized membrane protein